MKEIIYKAIVEKEKEYSDEGCKCGGRLYHSDIPCPVQKPAGWVTIYDIQVIVAEPAKRGDL